MNEEKNLSSMNILHDKAKRNFPSTLCGKKKLKERIRKSKYNTAALDSEFKVKTEWLNDVNVALESQRQNRMLWLTAIAAVAGTVALIDIILRALEIW